MIKLVLGIVCLHAVLILCPPLPRPQVTFKPDLSTAEVHDENIKGALKVGQHVVGEADVLPQSAGAFP